MPHYQRNIRFLFFLVTPILGFLLGWSLSQQMQTNATVSPPLETSVESDEELHNSLNIGRESILDLSPFSSKKDTPKDVDLGIFWETWNQLESSFIDTEDFKTSDQIYGATKGLVGSLGDPYTTFLAPDDVEEFQESMSGEFQGIGAYIEFKDKNIVIVAPIKGSPAEKYGLKPGDIVYKINDEFTHDMSLDTAVTKIRGPKDTAVLLTIVREGERKPLEINIIRDEIVIKSVEWEMKEEIAVISLYQFGTHATEEFQSAVEEIVLKSPKAIIVDLRNNGGGLLDSSVDIMSEFLDRKVVVKTRGRGFGSTGDLVSRKGGSLLNTPLVILINGGSASASEIFAGAMQDHNRGYVLGSTSFGKGSVQEVVPLSDGSALKVTVSEWLTPAGRSIHEVGIDPDEEVEITDEDFAEEIDTVMVRAQAIINDGELAELMMKQAENLEKSVTGSNTKEDNDTAQE